MTCDCVSVAVLFCIINFNEDNCVQNAGKFTSRTHKLVNNTCLLTPVYIDNKGQNHLLVAFTVLIKMITEFASTTIKLHQQTNLFRGDSYWIRFTIISIKQISQLECIQSIHLSLHSNKRSNKSHFTSNLLEI